MRCKTCSLFQSTHPRGVRRAGSPGRSSLRCFNPRTREGCDPRDGGLPDHHPVSIHAPARGATLPPGRLRVPGRVSIHAPARGATPASLLPVAPGVFQSTHPRGVRREVCGALSATMQFQSTHPRGVRLGVFAGGSPFVLFQSTHPRGVRLSVGSFYDVSMQIIIQLSRYI